ncbi:MAG: peptide chain release factor N(5)-glutamine methyltransferase [Phreatobacter sp.]|nr:peptide chain release factor N(5)-glutamine methyltransferase [Phreatobacter sp.]
MIPAGTSLGAARRLAADRLAAAGIEEAASEARILLRLATGLDPALPGGAAGMCLDPAQCDRVEAFLARRLSREPVARIIGTGAFHGLDLTLNAACLIPRDDTEALVAAALDLLPPYGPARILDLGVGPGTVLLAILSERREASGLGIDLSAEALVAARDNARTLGLADRAAFAEGCWTQGLAAPFDLIVSNPPYIPAADCERLAPEVALHDPRLALDGGADGLDAYRAIFANAGRVLKHGGHVAVEIGIGQAPDVAGIARACGFRLARLVSDLAGIPRALVFAAV